MSAENKTKATEKDVVGFINQIENQRRREDAFGLLALFSRITGEKPIMWGSSIIGYGCYTYVLANGKKEQSMRSGFSPRKQNLTIYVGALLSENKVSADILAKLGKHKISKACLYINKLADVDLSVLADIIRMDLDVMNQRYTK